MPRTASDVLDIQLLNMGEGQRPEFEVCPFLEHGQVKCETWKLPIRATIFHLAHKFSEPTKTSKFN